MRLNKPSLYHWAIHPFFVWTVFCLNGDLGWLTGLRRFCHILNPINPNHPPKSPFRRSSFKQFRWPAGNRTLNSRGKNPVLCQLSYGPVVAATGFEPVFEAYETSELTITLNRILLCWPNRIRTRISAFVAQYSSIELKANCCATFRFELKTSTLCLPPRKRGRWLCCRYTRPHSFDWLSSSRSLSGEPCSLRSQRNTIPGKRKTTFAVRTGIEPVTSDRQSGMLAVTPTNPVKVAGQLPPLITSG